MIEQKTTRHVLGLSGGRDSAALAVYMRQNHPGLEIDYFFTDTGKELPEVYEFLSRLEGFLGKEILRLNSKKEGNRDFDYWLRQNNYFLPSARSRWCTIQLKLRPFEKWVKQFLNNGEQVCSYVAIRSDEEYREGYKSKDENLKTILPFKEAGIDKNGVISLLEASGLGLPKYYEWRSRSGCTFCFFQRKIEWVRLAEHHPEAFEEAMAYEKQATEQHSGFTWCDGESLAELIRPERVAQIKADFEKRLNRLSARRVENPLRSTSWPVDVDEVYGQNKGCLMCHK